MSAPTGVQAAVAFGSWPTETYLSDRKQMFFNGEPIEIIHQPVAHTDGDSIVFFRRSDVVVAGDVYDTTSYPFIDLERGGSIQGEINALNNLLELAIPGYQDEGGTYIIPGNGFISDRPDLLEYRDMVTAAEWEVVAGARGPVPGGAMKVMTTKMKPGYLRRNGVPYSANAVVTEYFDRVTEPNGDSWLIVKTIVDDPQYLAQPFITSTHFKKQDDASGWNPMPCSAR